MSTGSRAGGFGIGVLVGVAVGLVAGILYATRSGEETRELLREKERQARYKTAEYAERARDAISKARKIAKAKPEE